MFYYSTLNKSLLLLLLIEEEGLCVDDVNDIMRLIGTKDISDQQQTNRGTNLCIDIRNSFMIYFISPEG